MLEEFVSWFGESPVAAVRRDASYLFLNVWSTDNDIFIYAFEEYHLHMPSVFSCWECEGTGGYR